MSKEVICKIRNITKRFSEVTALNDVSFDIKKGEVHAIVGENGAGKSTLMNILLGVFRPDEGSIEFNGEHVNFREPREALSKGIAMIHQELSLSPHMSVAENIFEGRLLKNKFGFIDRKTMYKNCDLLLQKLGVTHIKPQTLVKKLSISEMQLVEIAKAMSLDSKMLIMDEPTSSLTDKEVELLLSIVDNLRKDGVTVLYISHKLEEIMKIADTITVLRDGRHIDTRDKNDMDEKTMINLMVGRNFDKFIDRVFMTDYSGRKPVLEVKNLSDEEGRVVDVSFTLYEGEILGLTGLVGAGRTELLQSIFGARRMKSGVIKIDGRKVTINNTKDAIDMGMALVPENRKEEGLFLKMTVQDNMNILIYKKLKSLLGLIDKRKSQDKANEYLNKFKIKTPSLLQNIRNLSGGNQQKTIIARWLMNNPKILFMDEPTRGIDVGAKNEVYRIIDSLCKQGVSIVLLSSELPEVLSMCDRIMVMHNGRLKGILMNNEADQTKIMSYTLQEA